MATPNQVKIIYALLGENNLRDEKENIVQAFSGGKTTSVRAMLNMDANALISHLKSMDYTATRVTKMRNKILFMAHEMGWERSVATSAKKKVDMEHLNAWCEKHGYLKKKLDEYKYEELPKLITQFEEVYKSHLKAI